MKMKTATAYREFRRDQAGTFTLESTLVMPTVLIVMLFVLLFAVLAVERSFVYYRSAIVAERVAFNWSNSAKSYETGAFPDSRYDGLYRRLFQDGALHRLFGMGSRQEEFITVTFPAIPDSDQTDSRLPERKLRIGAAALTEDMTGKISYRNDFLWGKIGVQTKGNSVFSPLRTWRGDAKTERSANVEALAVEPAEWIRSFELIRYFTSKIGGSKQEASAYRSEASTVLRRAGASR